MSEELKPLWPNGHKLGLISVSGEHESGKSLFGLTVCPESVCVIDTERSVESYETAFHLKRVRKLDEIAAQTSNAVIDLNSVAGLKADSISRKRCLDAVVEKIPAGRWRVIVVDVLTDVEDSFADYVEVNAGEFGYSTGQFAKMSGLKWKCVKRIEKTLLLRLMDKCECVVVARHMRDRWENGVRRNEREAKGLDSIDELSSLTVILERKTEKDGSKPGVPSALLVKSRLVHTEFVNGEVKTSPMFPPRFAKFSPADVRHYILNPPNYDKLKKGEKAEKADLTEDEKLLIQSQIAADQRAAAEVAAATQAVGKPEPLPPPNLTGDSKPVKEKLVAKQPQKSPLKATNGSAVSEPLLDELKRLKAKLEIDGPAWADILERFDAPIDTKSGHRSAAHMEPNDQSRLATYLSGEIDKRVTDSKRQEMVEFASAGN